MKKKIYKFPSPRGVELHKPGDGLIGQVEFLKYVSVPSRG